MLLLSARQRLLATTSSSSTILSSDAATPVSSRLDYCNAVLYVVSEWLPGRVQSANQLDQQAVGVSSINAFKGIEVKQNKGN